MIKRQDKKYRYSKKDFCEEREKDVVIEAIGIVVNCTGGKVMKCGSVKCSERSYPPYLCPLETIDDCVIVQEIKEEIESNRRAIIQM